MGKKQNIFTLLAWVMGQGKTEWEDILIEKGIIKGPSESAQTNHPDIEYSTSNKITDDDDKELEALFNDDDSKFLEQYK